jgi:hypothetical protein
MGNGGYCARSNSDHYSFVFPAALAFAHRAFAAAARAALPAALILRFRAGLAAGALPCAAILFATPARIFAIPCALSFLLGAVPLIFAQRNLAAAAMRARPAALILRLLGFPVSAGGVETSPPRISLSSFCRASILSLMSAAFRNCAGDSLMIEFIVRQLRLFLRELSTQEC